MSPRSKPLATKAIALLAAILSTAVAQPVSAQTSTVLDPVGDTFFRNAPAFQDVVFGQMTKTANGDFELFMELAGSIPANPPMPPQQRSELWWGWSFDLDPTAFPHGFPWPVGQRSSEFLFLVRWDGTAFAATAIDRRPLLTGGEAIVTPVPFNISDTMVAAVLPFELIGEVPPTFGWAPFTIGWAGPAESEGVFVIDVALTVFDPSQPESAQVGTALDPPTAPSNCTTRTMHYRDRRMGEYYTWTTVSWRDNSDNEDGFTVERWWRNQSGVWVLNWSVDVAANSTESGFDRTAGGDYRFRVKAFNASGDSAWSNWH